MKTVPALVARGFHPLAYRLMCLQAHYRSELEFSWENLAAAQTRLKRLIQTVAALRARGEAKGAASAAPYAERLDAALSDDLNTPKALPVLDELLADKRVSPADRLAALTPISFYTNHHPILGLTPRQTPNGLSSYPGNPALQSVLEAVPQKLWSGYCKDPADKSWISFMELWCHSPFQSLRGSFRTFAGVTSSSDFLAAEIAAVNEGEAPPKTSVGEQMEWLVPVVGKSSRFLVSKDYQGYSVLEYSPNGTFESIPDLNERE